MAGGGTGDTSASTGGTSGGMTGGVPGTGFGGGSTMPGQMPLYQTAQTPFSGYRPAPMGGQFFQPIYRPEYQNYSNPMTAFNVSSYGTSPVPSAAYMRAMDSRGIGLPGLYQNLQNYAANYMATPGASFGRLLSDMGSQGVSPMDMQMAYGGFGRGLGRFSPFFGSGFGQGYSQGYGQGFGGGFMGGVPSMTTPFSRPSVPEMYMFSQYPTSPMGSMGQSLPGQLIYGPTAADPTQRAIPTQAQFAAQQSILKDPQAAALAAARQGLAAGMTNQQIADMVNRQYGKSFSAQNVADFIAANQAALKSTTGSTSTGNTGNTGSTGNTGNTGYTGNINAAGVDYTQQATPTATQLAAQQKIVANPQQAALDAVTSGLKSGMSPQAIADQINAQYGKSFNAANVIAFANANNIPLGGSTSGSVGGTTGIGETQQKAGGGILSLMRRK